MKSFIKNNEEFTCLNCGNEVGKHDTSSRDHCNKCLYGLHVDINPGDRLNSCRGLLVPIGIRKSKGREQIAYDCEKCSQRVYCIVAKDDDKELLIELGTRTWK